MSESSNTPEHHKPEPKKITRRQFLVGAAAAAAGAGLAAAGLLPHKEQDTNLPSYLKAALKLVDDVQRKRVHLVNNGANFSIPSRLDYGSISVSADHHEEQENLRLAPNELMNGYIDYSNPISTINLVVETKDEKNQTWVHELDVFNSRAFMFYVTSPYFPIPGESPKSHSVFTTYFDASTEQPIGYTVYRSIYRTDSAGKEVLDYSQQTGTDSYPSEIYPQKPTISEDVKDRMNVVTQGLSQEVKK